MGAIDLSTVVLLFWTHSGVLGWAPELQHWSFVLVWVKSKNASEAKVFESVTTFSTFVQIYYRYVLLKAASTIWFLKCELKNENKMDLRLSHD